jgi:hypothetical protein
MSERFEEYIGDGVTASWDGYHIWLRTPRLNGTHEIGLDPYTFDALNRYSKRLGELLREEAVQHD